jgi:predicted transcriptional regulator YheO
MIGALCINFNISLLIQLSGELQNFIRMEDVLQSTIENIYSSVHEVIEVVRRLDKGATEYLAAFLGVSKLH